MAPKTSVRAKKGRDKSNENGDLFAELLNSYSANLQAVENHAMSILFKKPIAIFSAAGLPILTPRQCWELLESIRSLKLSERCFMMAGLTDYVACECQGLGLTLAPDLAEKWDFDPGYFLHQIADTWKSILQRRKKGGLRSLDLYNLISSLESSIALLKDHFLDREFKEVLTIATKMKPKTRPQPDEQQPQAARTNGEETFVHRILPEPTKHQQKLTGETRKMSSAKCGVTPLLPAAPQPNHTSKISNLVDDTHRAKHRKGRQYKFIKKDTHATFWDAEADEDLPMNYNRDLAADKYLYNSGGECSGLVNRRHDLGVGKQELVEKQSQLWKGKNSGSSADINGFLSMNNGNPWTHASPRSPVFGGLPGKKLSAHRKENHTPSTVNAATSMKWKENHLSLKCENKGKLNQHSRRINPGVPNHELPTSSASGSSRMSPACSHEGYKSSHPSEKETSTDSHTIRHTGSKPVIKEKLPKLRFKHYLKKKFTASFPDMKTDTTDVSASRKRTTSFTDHERQSKRSLSTIYDDDDDELPDLTPPIVSASHSLLGDSKRTSYWPMFRKEHC